ncbi:MAG: hypothetical protein M1609_14305 [Firmicutes bacterium]|nr:hypothetical protein [Bacillota bacterium]
MGTKEFALMKPTAILVNTAGGAVVDEEALYQALKNRQIWAAGLDVFQTEPLPPDHKLLTLDNCIVAPHLGSATYNTRARMALTAARGLVAALAGRTPEHLVNPDYRRRI